MRNLITLKHYIPLLLKIIDVMLMIMWPFIVLYLIYQDKLQLIGIWLLGYFLLRYAVLSKTAQFNKQLALLFTLIGALLSVLSLIFKSYHMLLYYPIMVNITLLCFFSYSLYQPPSVIEQLARIQQPNLSPYGRRYTFRVTQVWCLFFIFNASASLFTVLWGDIKLWAWWNGFISYCLIGSLFLAEYCIRKRVQRLDPQNSQHNIQS